MKTLFLVVLLYLSLLVVGYADTNTQCQQQGVYTDCTTTNTNDSGKSTETFTQCQRQGVYTDCITSDNNFSPVD